MIISGVWTGLAGEPLAQLFTGAVPAKAAGDQELLSGSRAAALGGHARLDCTGAPHHACPHCGFGSALRSWQGWRGLVLVLTTVECSAGDNGATGTSVEELAGVWVKGGIGVLGIGMWNGGGIGVWGCVGCRVQGARRRVQTLHCQVPG